MNQQRTGTNPVTVETADPVLRLRLQRMARELRLTDQILSFDVDSVSIVESGPAPAWTSADGSSITINVNKMPYIGGRSRKAVAVWLGTNAHELFHNLYTPRADSALMRRVSAAERSYASGIHRVWNLLEDQRIERLGLARYAAWRGYLVAALAHHIPVAHPEAWTLVAGRTWLSDEVRAIARLAFVRQEGEDRARKVAELIGDYQRLGEPGDLDSDEAWRIVSEFHRLFGETIPPKGSCGGSVVQGGEPQDTTGEYVPFPTADEADEDEPEDEPQDDDDDAGSYQSDDDDAEGDDDADGEGDDADADADDEGDDADGSGDGDDEADDEGDDGSDMDGDDGSGAAEGEGAGDDDGDEGDDGDGDGADGRSEQAGEGEPGDGVSHEGTGQRSMAEAMADDVDEQLDADETSADLDRVVDQLHHGHAGRGNLPKTTGQYLDATDAARSLSRGVAEVLAEIRDDCEASWVRRTDTGRFSVARWATDPDWDADNVFDLFDPGSMDASSLDAVLVLDVSGSMSGQIHRLAEATWAIRQAVDRVEGQCTGIGFGDDASEMFATGSRPDGRMFVPHLESSTNPVTACREAYRIVADSVATNRLVIVLTDGQWWDAGPALAALRAARDCGATTCIVGLGQSSWKYVKGMVDDVDIVATITDSGELVPIFRDMAERSMLAAAGR